MKNRNQFQHRLRVCHLLGTHCAVALLASATTTAAPMQGQQQDLSTPPCPNIERLCDSAPPEHGDPVEELCQCGPGEWITTTRPPALNPSTPISQSLVTSDNSVTCRSRWTAVASQDSARVTVELSAWSNFWRAGSSVKSQMAQFSGGWTEAWRGTFPACARTVLLSANGGGALLIAATCSARYGCTASASATTDGMASSRGQASAVLSSPSIQGTVAFDSLTRSTLIEGNFGATIELLTPSIEGSFSSESSWEVVGTGSATGTLSFSVAPDRTYCAMTNLPIKARWNGTVAVALALTVDDNGSAAGVGEAALTLSVD